MQVSRLRIYTSLSQRQVYIGSGYVREEVSNQGCGHIYIYIENKSVCLLNDLFSKQYWLLGPVYSLLE